VTGNLWQIWCLEKTKKVVDLNGLKCARLISKMNLGQRRKMKFYRLLLDKWSKILFVVCRINDFYKFEKSREKGKKDWVEVSS